MSAPESAHRLRTVAFAITVALSISALQPTMARAQEGDEECADDCDDAAPALTPAERRNAIAMYERRAIIFGVTGTTLLVGAIATLVAATATWSGSVCDISTPECVDTAKVLNSVSAGATLLGVIGLVLAGVSTTAAARERDRLEDDDQARLRVRLGASPDGASVVLTSSF